MSLTQRPSPPPQGMSMVALTRTINEIGEAFADFKKVNDERVRDLKAKIDALETNGAAPAEITTLRERVEELEARRNTPGAVRRTEPQGYTVHHVGNDNKVYELSAQTKMADVIQPEKEPPISLDRWLAASLLGEKCRDREAVEYARSIQALTTTSTGVLIPTEYISAWIDNLREQMVLTRAGITTVTMQEKTQTHSRVLTDPVAAWRAEAGAITATDPTFELRNLVAKSLAVRVTGTVELAADSPDFGAQLMAVMGRAMALEVDQAGILGAGGSAPQGVIGTSGVNTITSVGVLADYDKFVDAIAQLWIKNVPEDRVGPFLVSPQTLQRIRKLKTGIASDKTTLEPPPGLPPFLVTSTLNIGGSPPTSSAVVGDWADLVLGVRREASVESLRLQTYASNLQVEYVGYGRFDFLVRRPPAFTTLTGISN